MTSGVVVSSVLLTGNQLLWVEQVLVGTSTDLVDHIGLQVHV